MFFFKIEALPEDAELAKQIKRSVRKRSQISDKACSYNEKNDGKVFCFISEAIDEDLICGIISHTPIDATSYANSFFNHLEIKIKEIETDETTFCLLRKLLRTAQNNNYIEDSDEVLTDFSLRRLSKDWLRYEFKERFIHCPTNKKLLYNASKDYFAEETLCPELDRIFSGNTNVESFGHPVHYLIETDSSDIRTKISHTLLQALLFKKRIRSSRYICIDVCPDSHIELIDLFALYKCGTYGAIVINYESKYDSEDSDYTDSEAEIISLLCNAMMEYQHEVLTVICLPKSCEKIKRLFNENLVSVGFVEIKENPADVAISREHLKMHCQKNKIKPDKKLYSKLLPDKTYTLLELHDIFSEWFYEKLKTTVYPQYKNIQTCRKKLIEEKVKGKAFDKLNELIGLESAKTVISKALNYYKLQQVYKDKGVKQDRPAMHMVFTGNPGTAKTTVARIFAQIMKENKLLSNGHLVEVGRSDLVGKYVGWTAQIVKEKFKKAMGGVLFIDEAYSLVDDRNGMYGDEAINTIVQEMENNREDLVVIFAGYPNEMELFLDKNPGLRSRIAFHVPFQDYSTEELCEIAKLIGKSKGVSLTDKAVEKLSVVFENARTCEDFGNGRFVRNVLELSKMNQASRILALDPNTVNKKTLTTIEETDIDVPVVKKIQEKHPIGFAI